MIRGEDRRNPVSLFLHGGPGETTSLWSLPFFAPWQREFTVAQWDQRGAGRTYGRNGASIESTVTVNRIVQDGIHPAKYLPTHLPTTNTITAGHSSPPIAPTPTP